MGHLKNTCGRQTYLKNTFGAMTHCRFSNASRLGCFARHTAIMTFPSQCLINAPCPSLLANWSKPKIKKSTFRHFSELSLNSENIWHIKPVTGRPVTGGVEKLAYTDCLVFLCADMVIPRSIAACTM